MTTTPVTFIMSAVVFVLFAAWSWRWGWVALVHVGSEVNVKTAGFHPLHPPTQPNGQYQLSAACVQVFSQAAQERSGSIASCWVDCIFSFGVRKDSVDLVTPFHEAMEGFILFVYFWLWENIKEIVPRVRVSCILGDEPPGRFGGEVRLKINSFLAVTSTGENGARHYPLHWFGRHQLFSAILFNIDNRTNSPTATENGSVSNYVEFDLGIECTFPQIAEASDVAVSYFAILFLNSVVDNPARLESLYPGLF
ncbi:hypothetical protein BC830DRAFT_1085683 [Chytriomyces sp. MP71]|nr:hypothetical protein BC830DRAFT_1085683 [Chytriomyces sp. MP71]